MTWRWNETASGRGCGCSVRRRLLNCFFFLVLVFWGGKVYVQYVGGGGKGLGGIHARKLDAGTDWACRAAGTTGGPASGFFLSDISFPVVSTFIPFFSSRGVAKWAKNATINFLGPLTKPDIFHGTSSSSTTVLATTLNGGIANRGKYGFPVDIDLSTVRFGRRGRRGRIRIRIRRTGTRR